MKRLPRKLFIHREDKGRVMAQLPSGLVGPVWREEFLVQVGEEALAARCDVPEDGGADPLGLEQRRVRESISTLQFLAKQLADKSGYSIELKLETDGQGVIAYFLTTAPGVKPLKGVELILVRGLAHRIHDQHPKWPRDKVNEILALARIGKGPYAAEWQRMTARGPARGPGEDADGDAPSV